MPKISFVWQGVTERKNHWNDGLRAAMRILEGKYDVSYYEPWDEIPDDSIILHWEAPCSTNGSNKENYDRIHNAPNKKVLLFAGGPIKKEWVENYNVVAVESEINEKEFEALGVPWARAFGVNTEIFKPFDEEKKWAASAHGTCASWKRQWLLCEALGEEALVFGAFQPTDSKPFDECRKCNSTVIEEVPYDEVVKLLNQSYVSVNGADFWGGGQRATLEAMACDIPVVVMKDSPKNIEFVERAGIGLIVDPQPEHIKNAVRDLHGLSGGRDYVMDNWTEKHYAMALEGIIEDI